MTFLSFAIETKRTRHVRRATTPGGAAVSTVRSPDLFVGDNFDTLPIRTLESGTDVVLAALNASFRRDSTTPGGTIIDPLRMGLAESRPETTLRSLARSSGARLF